MVALKDHKTLNTENFFSTDHSFQKILAYHLGDASYDRLSQVLSAWERNIPSWNVMANEAAKPEKLPSIQNEDHVGNPIERVVVPLETRLIRHRVVEAGIFKNESEVEKFAKVYFLAHIGESGVTCPLACTDGLIRVLQAKGSESLKNKYLDALLSSETPLAGSQFVTERAGGSDVGAIEGIAKYIDDGECEIHAQKWYCSTPEEFFLVAARPEGADKGTKGLAIFFVPRLVTKGGGDATQIPNNLHYKRLKDKLGTQSLPTAEIDFNGSRGYLIGAEAEGFSNLMNYVLNCSRIHNAANALGFLRRAFLEARHYAKDRETFGVPIIEHPLVAEHLVNMYSELTAKQNMFVGMLAQIDINGWTPEDHNQKMWQRFLINLLKYRTSHELTERVKEAILVFGANGIVNDFSILPRLIRDSLVIETWEGTHNTLSLQIMRDAHKFNLFERLNQEIENIITDWPEHILHDSKRFYTDFFEMGKEVFKPANLYDPKWVQTHAKRVLDHYADLLETGSLIRMGAQTDNCNALIAASHLIHERMGDRFSSFASPALDNLTGICRDLIEEKPISIEMK